MDSILKRRFRAKKTQEHLIIATTQYDDDDVFNSIKDGLSKYRENNDFPAMEAIPLFLGGRCLTRPMLRLSMRQHQVSTFIIGIDVDQPYDYLPSYIREDVECELKENSQGGKVVFLFKHKDMGNNEINYTPSQEYSELIDDFSKIHRTAYFNICAKTGEGIDKAFDWLADQIAQDVAKKAELKAASSKKNGLHWLAEVGKKVLSFGLAHN